MRPLLSRALAAAEFRAFYWLKEELAAFCRAEGFPASGSKLELTDRIATYLATGAIAQPPARSYARKGPHPLTLDAAIGPNFRCSQEARAFFKEAIGPRFHFSTGFQQHLRQHPGDTLADAVAFWHEQATRGPEPKALAPQFEYNQHMRDYFAQHPGATRLEAIAAWKKKRSERRNTVQ